MKTMVVVLFSLVVFSPLSCGTLEESYYAEKDKRERALRMRSENDARWANFVDTYKGRSVELLYVYEDEQAKCPDLEKKDELSFEQFRRSWLIQTIFRMTQVTRVTSVARALSSGPLLAVNTMDTHELDF